MVTGQIKNKIDKIWDDLHAGGLTNPVSVVEQLTYLLFMRMLDAEQVRREGDMAAIKAAMGPDYKMELTDVVFPPHALWTNPETDQQIPYSDLRWSVFKNMAPPEMFRMVRTHVFTFIKTFNTGKESAYTRFMTNATFEIPTPRLLVKLVEGIDGLDVGNRDMMGDIYEYILGKMAASGTNGQFRTPRHIISMMVQLMQPRLDDKICDPAMGSAGFIVESAKYVRDHYSEELMKSVNQEYFRNHLFHGFDTDPKMLRIGAMNLMLHRVDNPVVQYRDSLSEENHDTDLYTLILANPPFAGSLDYEAVSKSLLAIAKTRKTELLFIELFMRSLRIGGRCASIVPDGVLTGSSKAHRTIRQDLVDKHRLQAVISMPSGVFKPYAGVSTAILIFTKTGAGGTDKVWFYDMRADGYSLDDKRLPVDANDILDIIERFHHPEMDADRPRTAQSFFVPVEEIREKGYDLSFNQYREVIREKVHYDAPADILARLSALETQFHTAMTDLQTLLTK